MPDRYAMVRKISSASFWGIVVVGSIIDQFLQGEGNTDDLLEDKVCVLKSSGSTRTALVELDSHRPSHKSEKLFVKEFLFKNTLHSLKPLFCQHRAQIAWHVSWYLLNRGVLVPEPEGYLIKKKGPFCLKGFFFCKVLSTCSSLSDLSKDPEQLSRRLDSGGLIRVIARNVGALHNGGVTHGDLKWSNILVHEKTNRLWLVDLDSAKLYGRCPSPKAVARDLARFVLSGLEAGIDQVILDSFVGEYAHHRKLPRERIDGPMSRALKKLKRRHAKKR